MSLDLYIKTKTPTHRKSSGIFTRVNGETFEILTLEDFHKYLPNCDDSQFKVYESDDEELWSGNITHNLGRMAEHIATRNYTLYELLWHPSESGFLYANREYKYNIYNALKNMLLHRDELQQYNPENGWGSYDSLLHFVQSFAEALSKLDADDYELYASI